jgi:hypothetical protein
MTDPKSTPTTPVFKRTDDLVSRYANNARFEPNVFDLKMVFGQGDSSTGEEVIHQHTAITLPWSVVKLVIYYLRLHLMVYEADNGNVKVPSNQTPQAFPELPPGQAESPAVKRALESVSKLRDDFISSM